LIWVLALCVIPAGLYGWYVLRQIQSIAAFNQRELARAAENLRAILVGSATNVANTRSKPSFTCAFLNRQPYLAMPSRREGCETYQEMEPKKEKVTVDTGDGIRICAGDGFCFQVAVDKILDELVLGSSFEYLFVADGKGKVFYQARRGERQRWRDNLRWQDRHLADDTISTALPVRLGNLADVVRKTGGNTAQSPSTQTTGYIPVEVARQQYWMYLQPVQIDSTGDSIVIGGLVNTRANVASAMAVEPGLALVLAVLVGLGLLTWPVLKLLVIAPSERFTFGDSNLLLLSGAALLAVCTVVCLDAANYYRVRTMGEARLKLLAGDLAAGLAAELSRAVNELSRFDDEAAAQLKGKDCEVKNGTETSAWEQTGLFAASAGGEHRASANRLALTPPKDYWNLAAVFWTDRAGQQFGKATGAKANTPLVNLSARPYFQAARGRHLWSVAGASRPFYTQVYRSVTTGEFETGISVRSNIVCKDGSDGNVAVLTTTLASLSPKALPPDYGFMMIDRSGRVLYHSDPRRALREDLFEEVSNASRLRAIVEAERAAPFRATYGDSVHEFYVRPLFEVRVSDSRGAGQQQAQDLNGWYIIAFRDMELLQTANTESAVSALIWCAAYFLVVLFVPALAIALRKPPRNEWMWPDRAKAERYKRVTIYLVILAGAMTAAITRANGPWLVAFSFLSGACTIGLALWEYGRSNGRGRYARGDPQMLKTPTRFRAWRTACVVSTFLSIAVRPAAGLFKFAWNDETERVAAYEDKRIAQAVGDLKLDIESRARRQFADAYGTGPTGWNSTGRRYLDAVEQDLVWSGSPPGIGEADGREDYLAGWKSVYNDASVALRYQAGKRKLSPQQSAVLFQFGMAPLLGMATLIAAFAAAVSYCDRRLLLVDLNIRPDDVRKHVEAAWRNGRSALVLVHSHDQEITALTMMSARAAAAASGRIADAQRTPARVEAFCLTDTLQRRETRTEALQRMEEIAFCGHGLVVSRVDPAQSLFGATSAPGDLDDRERHRWSDVLQRFSLILASPEPGPERKGEPADEVHTHLQKSPYYAYVWDSCTDDERLVLIQVAEEGFANPRMPRTVERLLRRGLLVKNPALQPFEPAFGRYVRDVYDRSKLKEWERPSRGMGWSQSRWVLTLGLATLAIFLVATQRESLNPVVTFIPPVAGAVTAVLKLIGDLSLKSKPG
jgi:hypothetical protein